MARILIIDDTKNIRKTVELALKGAGYEVQTANDGRAGLELFGDGANWDLTLVDQQMPELNGDEFVVEARKRDPLARIVMMTAFATPELAAQVMGSGALDFLRKPFTLDTLRDAVKVALSHPRIAESVGEFDPDPALPQPGEEGYVMPRLSYRINGFTFWPLAVSQTGAPAPGFALGRLFQVHAPGGGWSSCFAGITPHVRAQIESEIGRAIPDDDAAWDRLCGQTLLALLSQKPQVPPDVLPVFEVPPSRASRSGVSWGAFFGG